MLGRKRMFDKVCGMITKPTPDNVSIVGPKLYGKTVLLQQIYKFFSKRNESYIGSVYIDLKHDTPQTDLEFIKVMAKGIRSSIQDLKPDLAKELFDTDDDSLFDILKLVLEHFAGDKERMLVVFDGFDPLPIGSTISPNLLDQLRTLVELPSLTLVVGSRLRLRELCKTEATRGSDFWRNFAGPVEVGCFDESDMDDILSPLVKRSVTVEKGAKTELMNWTGGIPVLLTQVLGNLYDQVKDSITVSNTHVNDICINLKSEVNDFVADIWSDCGTDTQSLISDATAGELLESAISTPQRRELELKGIGIVEQGKVVIKSRFVSEYASEMTGGLHDMARLFSQEKDFNVNIKKLLEIRLSHIPHIDDQLFKDIQLAIRDLTEDHRRVLDASRSIVESTLNVILKAEGLDPAGVVPAAWKESWQRYKNNTVAAGDEPVPSDRGLQCRLVRFITGRSDNPRVAHKISRQTSVLLDQISAYGNYVNHLDGETVRFGTAYGMCFTAIELMASLAADVH